MKAIYNTTGEIVNIEDMSIVTYKESDGTYVKTPIKNFTFIDAEKDYYTKLEHQYAGMAMQGMLNNSLLITSLLKVNKSHEDIVAEVTGTAIRYAHALVQKQKEKEERK